ncbi:MAG: B12-binding domain-containing radical SAM protein [Bacteroidetes bacterium]|nr:B12-binding domain-containing radical SAM protein [Bacteroidota bacterium]
MKVLFTHSYFLKFDEKQYRAAMPYPPLGTLYAMAYLREHGFEVKLFDTMFCDSAKDIRQTIDEFMPDVFVSYDDGFNYLTKMCLTNMREACFDMQLYAASKGCKVITSSSDATDHAEEYLKHGSDVIVIGEAEQTVLELCSAFKNNNALEIISGIAIVKEGNIFKTIPRHVIKDLDVLPPPAWDALNISPYKTMWMKHHGYFSLNFVTTRGCPYKCNWCAKPIYGNRYNSHSPEQIVSEIKKWQQQFGFTHVWFADDIFGLKPNWLKDFEFHIKKAELKINYKIQSRADLLLGEDHIKHLANSGCTMVWMGAESGSQTILDAMDKGIKVEQIYEATRLLKKNNIHVSLFLQLGYLGETMKDIKLTIKMVEDLLPDDIGISVSYPLPGTVFYDKVKEQLREKSNWTDSDDLSMLFKNTYKPEFYKQLQRYIHKVYRRKEGMQSAKKIILSPSKRHLKKVLSLWHLIPQEQMEKRKLKHIDPDATASL